MHYRIVPAEKFLFEPVVKDGLRRVKPVDGFDGVYKTTKNVNIYVILETD